MITIACVLKTGGFNPSGKTVEYAPRHVLAIQKMLMRHVSIPFQFVCLSDVAIDGVTTIPLKHNWPGWWSKMELFRPDILPGQVFYLDLDTVLTGNIDVFLEHAHKFTMLQNLTPGDVGDGRYGSGLMAWHGDFSHLYAQFLYDADKFMALYRRPRAWGDQDFIKDHLEMPPATFQRLFPGQVVSYKFHLNGNPPAPENSIVCFHGVPKPCDVKDGWVPQYYPY